MKTHILKTLIILIIGTKHAIAFGPVTTYTFVDPCTPFAIISPIANTYGCFSFSATNAGMIDPNAYYTWNFGDGTTETGTYVYHCYSTSTVSQVFSGSITYNSPLCGSPRTQNYTVSVAANNPSVCVYPPPSYTLAVKSLTIMMGVFIPETMFEFTFGDGSQASMYPEHTYAGCGNYIVKIRSWDMNMPQINCYANVAVNIACSPTISAINENESPMFKIKAFPNPASEILTIYSAKEINGIKLVDISGREYPLIYNLAGEMLKCNIATLPRGVYFLNMRFSDNSVTNLKVLKE